MISLNSIFILILIHAISNVHSEKLSGDVLGHSACGIYSVQKDACGIPDPPIESFPKECSSFIYGFTGYENGKIIDATAQGQSIKGYLDKLIQTNISVIIEYEHPGVKEWCAAVQCNNTAERTTEINHLKTFLDQHKGIKGIMLINLLEQSDPPLACPDYSQNLKSYIDLIKQTFTDLSIGISILVQEELNYYQNKDLPWLDFNVLDHSVNFYMLSTDYVNVCTDEFLKFGTKPLTGGNNSVDYARSFLEGVGVTSSKIHYRFSIFADTHFLKNYEFCSTFVTNYCKNPDAKTTLCADTIKSLYDKGAYAKKYGAGFVLSSIDVDDFGCTCQCGMSYPGFHAVLSGYNNEPPPPPCALFDRT